MNTMNATKHEILDSLLFRLKDKEYREYHYTKILNRYKKHREKTKKYLERQLKACELIKNAYLNNTSIDICPLCAAMRYIHRSYINRCEYCIWNIAQHVSEGYTRKCTKTELFSTDTSDLRRYVNLRTNEDKKYRIILADAQIDALKYMLKHVENFGYRKGW